jgi:hypothetical protein
VKCPRCYRPRSKRWIYPLCGVCRTSAKNKAKREAERDLGAYVAERVWEMIWRRQ